MDFGDSIMSPKAREIERKLKFVEEQRAKHFSNMNRPPAEKENGQGSPIKEYQKIAFEEVNDGASTGRSHLEHDNAVGHSYHPKQEEGVAQRLKKQLSLNMSLTRKQKEKSLPHFARQNSEQPKSFLTKADTSVQQSLETDPAKESKKQKKKKKNKAEKKAAKEKKKEQQKKDGQTGAETKELNKSKKNKNKKKAENNKSKSEVKENTTVAIPVASFEVSNANNVPQKTLSVPNQKRTNPNIFITEGLNIMKYLTLKGFPREKKVLIVTYLITILTSMILNSLELSLYVLSICSAQRSSNLLYFNFALMILCKIMCISTFNMELTRKCSYQIRVPFMIPTMMFGITPLFQAPQLVYDYLVCRQFNNQFSLSSAFQLVTAIAVIFGLYLLYLLAKSILNAFYVEFDVMNLPHVRNMVKRIKIVVGGVAMVSLNMVMLVMYWAQITYFLPTFFFEFYVWIASFIWMIYQIYVSKFKKRVPAEKPLKFTDLKVMGTSVDLKLLHTETHTREFSPPIKSNSPALSSPENPK